MTEHIRSEGSKESGGFNYYEVALSVKYATQQPFKDPSGKSLYAAGYFRKFVVVAASEHQTRQLVSIEVEDGEIDWQDSEIKRMSPSDLSEYSLGDDKVPMTPAVVFRSSHFLYPATEH